MTAREIDAALGADPEFAGVCDERDARYRAEIAALDFDTAADAALPWGPQWCGADALDLAAGEVVS